MKGIFQFSAGILTAIGSSLLVLAAGSLALLEGTATLAAPVPPSPTTIVLETSAPVSSDSTVPAAPTQPTLATATSIPQSNCPPLPTGWVPYIIQPGDSLESLAAKAGVTVNDIVRINCLVTTNLLPGLELSLPLVAPTNTVPPALPTAIPCGAPRGWVPYIVQEKDTLYRLSQEFGITVAQLQYANCISGTMIWAGQRLMVPYVPTRVPSPTVTATTTYTPTPTDTQPPVVENPTETFTATPTDTETPEPSLTPTDTSTPTPETPAPAPGEGGVDPNLTQTLTSTP